MTPDRDLGPVEAVIFDWGGTLTRWHDIDFHAESLALAQAVVNSHHDPAEVTSRLHRAGDVVWGRSRDHHRSATVADLFAEAGLDHDPDSAGLPRVLGAAHLHRTEVVPLFASCAGRGSRGRPVQRDLAPRWHEGFFRRDGVLRSSTGTSTPAIALDQAGGARLRGR